MLASMPKAQANRLVAAMEARIRRARAAGRVQEQQYEFSPAEEEAFRAVGQAMDRAAGQYLKAVGATALLVAVLAAAQDRVGHLDWPWFLMWASRGANLWAMAAVMLAGKDSFDRICDTEGHDMEHLMEGLLSTADLFKQLSAIWLATSVISISNVAAQWPGIVTGVAALSLCSAGYSVQVIRASADARSQRLEAADPASHAQEALYDEMVGGSQSRVQSVTGHLAGALALAGQPLVAAFDAAASVFSPHLSSVAAEPRAGGAAQEAGGGGTGPEGGQTSPRDVPAASSKSLKDIAVLRSSVSGSLMEVEDGPILDPVPVDWADASTWRNTGEFLEHSRFEGGVWSVSEGNPLGALFGSMEEEEADTVDEMIEALEWDRTSEGWEVFGRSMQFNLGKTQSAFFFELVESMHMAEIGASLLILSSMLNVAASAHALSEHHSGLPVVITSCLELRTWWLHRMVVSRCAGAFQEIATCERPDVAMLLSGFRGKFGLAAEYKKLGQSATRLASGQAIHAAVVSLGVMGVAAANEDTYKALKMVKKIANAFMGLEW